MSDKLLRSRHKFQQGEETIDVATQIPCRDKTMKRQTILSHNMKKGAVTKNQLLTKEMRSQHRLDVATQNVVNNKTARSRHRIY